MHEGRFGRRSASRATPGSARFSAMGLALMMLVGPLLAIAVLPVDLSVAARTSDRKFVRYSNNPVLSNGTGVEWDNRTILTNCFLQEGGGFRLYYTGGNGTMTAIGLVNSTDAKQWTRYSGNPILGSGPGGSWDQNGTSDACVLKDGSTYKMWFAGHNGTAWQIGYATSTDGLNWTEYAANPVLANGPDESWDGTHVRSPTVVKDDAGYRMWYAGYNGTFACIGLANSTDGVNWTRYDGNPVHSPGAKWAWDYRSDNSACVLNISGLYRMWYTGYNGDYYKIGYANSSDGIGWTDFEDNPIMGARAPGFESNSVRNPAVLHNGTTCLMMYTGVNDSGDYRFGYAEGYNTPATIINIDEPAIPSYTNNTRPKFRWGYSESDPGDYISTCQIQFDTDKQFGSVEYDTGAVSVNGPGYTLTDPLPDGRMYWRLRQFDADGDSSQWVGPYLYDLDCTPPQNPTVLVSTTHTVQKWSTSRFVNVQWYGATDEHINYYLGLKGYSYAWDYCATTVPDTTTEATNTATSCTSPAMSDSSSVYFHIRAVDERGNGAVENIHLGPFWIDATAPTNPVVESPTHTATAWSNQTLVTVNWSGARDPTSGPAGYSFCWDRNASGIPDTNTECDSSTNATISPGLSEGTWYFHLRTRDAAGNWAASAANFGPILIDLTAPFNPLDVCSTSHVPSVWSNSNRMAMQWAPGNASLSGISGYSLLWDDLTGTVPDETVDAESTAVAATSPAIPDGTNIFFHIRVRDGAGNWNSTAVHCGPFWIDTEAPENPVSVESGSHDVRGWSSDATIDVRWAFGSLGERLSGYEGVSVAWDQDNSTVPDTTVDYDANTTIATSPPLADGRQVYFHIRARDRAGNWADGAVHLGPFGIDVSPPLNPELLESTGHCVGQWSSDDTVEVRWAPATAAPSGVAGYGVLWDTRPNTVPPRTVNLTYPDIATVSPALESGLSWYVHVRTRDNAGSFADGAAHLGPFYIDTTCPVVDGLSIDGGRNTTNSCRVQLGISARDGPTQEEPEETRFSLDGANWTGWEPFHPSKELELSGPDGNRTVFVQVQDIVHNLGRPEMASILLDTRPPRITIFLERGALATNSPVLSIGVLATEPSPGSGGVEISFSQDDGRWTDWAPCCETMQFELSGPDGARRVSARSRDAAGNVGAPVFDEIFLDTRVPAMADLSVTGWPSPGSPTVGLGICATDAEPSAGLGEMSFREQGGDWTQWQPFNATANYTFGPGEGLRTVQARVRDLAGNIAPAIIGKIFIDTVAPTRVTMVLAGGKLGTSSRTVRVTLAVTDPEPSSGIDSVSFSEEGANWTAWAPFQPELDYTLRSAASLCTIHCRVRDQAGNIAEQVEASIIYDTAPPQILWSRIIGVGERTAIIEVAMNERSDVWLIYGKTTLYGNIVSSPAKTKIQTIQVTGLAPGKTYHCRICATDISGNGPVQTEDFILRTKGPSAQPAGMLSGMAALIVAAAAATMAAVIVGVMRFARPRRSEPKTRGTVSPALTGATVQASGPSPVFTVPPIEGAEPVPPPPLSGPQERKLEIREVVKAHDLEIGSESEDFSDGPPTGNAPVPEVMPGEEELAELIMSLPRGLPPSLWGMDNRELARKVLDGEQHTNQEGERLVRLGKRWYHADPADMDSFLQQYKGS